MEGELPLTAKAKLTEVNSYLTCPLCKGYYIDATTIVECLHSFCRSCIIQHLQQDNYCPICELMINTAKPNIKPDKTLQDIVYKLVPGLYAAEMAQRRRFWVERPAEATKVPCPESRGLMTERIIFSPKDAISLSIEYTSDEPAAWQRTEPDPEVPLRRYLQCPAMLRVEHLKKFICNKYNVDSQLYHVDILYKRVPLPDHYTLMDIAYIYSWKRNEPMKFFFRITDIALVSERFDYFEPSSKQNIPTSRCQQQHRVSTKQHTITNNNNNIEKKSASPVRQLTENNDASGDVIKTCDSDSKQTEQTSELSDNKKDGDEFKCEINEKSSEKCNVNKTNEQKDVVNNNQKEISDQSDKRISENSETNEEKIVVKIECEEETENTSDIKESANISSSKTEVLNDDSKVPSNNKSSQILPKTEPKETVTKNPPKIEPVVTESAEDAEKSQFFMSIQLTAKNTSPPVKVSSPPALKPINPELFRPKLTAQKRKYVRKSDKPIAAKKPKLTEIDAKIRKKESKDNDSKVKVKNIKNPMVRLMVSNLNKQATNLTKIVEQTNEHNQNEQLQSLIDSCKLNIPSSLSITLTESPRNEDGTIAQSKPTAIKPVQNYIEILKLPDKNIAEGSGENLTETPKKSDDKNAQNLSKALTNSQKHTFQTMFEETIKREESMKAQLFQIQNQAKSLEMAKKAANYIKVVFPKCLKKQNNALDLSTTSPKSETTSPSPVSPNESPPNIFTQSSGALPPKVLRSNGHTTPTPNSNKRNILEIAHQLSKRSRLETESQKSPTTVTTSSTSPKPKNPEPNPSSPPQKIIINNGFSSGGSISIKRSPKKISIPRLPVSKVPTPKLNPPNVKNGGLLKFSNYTAKLATSSTNPPKPPKVEPPNNTINGLTPNQLLEKYNITNLAQFNANLNQAQLAFQQALMVSHQLELHRMQQNSQKHWMANPNILAHYENYVQNLKNQQNQIVGNSSKN